MRRLKRKLALLWVLNSLIGVTIGYVLGSQPTMPECGLISNDPTAICYIAPYVPCDTDTDCLEKNGCGGYADPCE